MSKQLCAILDLKAEFYSAPFSVNTDAEAVRMFTQVAKDKDTSIGRHTQDFVLYRVGTYDDQTGIIKPHIPPQLIIAGTSLVPAE